MSVVTGRVAKRGALVIALTGIASAAWTAGSQSRSADEAFLGHLLGQWDMAGTMSKKSVHYRAEGRHVLQGGFLELHLIDADSPPQYEASVYLGYDAKAHDYVAHWLDRFGAAGARVVATGVREGQQLVLLFPYAEGAFRNTWTWHPDTHRWSLLIESETSDHKWNTFARFTLTLAVRRPQAVNDGRRLP